MLWWAVAAGMLTYALLIVLAVETRMKNGIHPGRLEARQPIISLRGSTLEYSAATR